MKFQRGLNPQIQDAIATLAYGRPSNTSPDSWYEVARIIDQNCTANEAFNSACQPLTPVTPGHDLPILALNSCLIVHESTICPLTVDIKTIMVQELQKELTEDTRQKVFESPIGHNFLGGTNLRMCSVWQPHLHLHENPYDPESLKAKMGKIPA